jgi:rhomboid protease GluP
MILMMLRFGSEVLFRPPYDIMSVMGGLVPVAWYDGEYWRLITYGYLHYGLWHIAFNMFALSQVGPLLEKEIGPARFFSAYTLTLIAGGAADLVLRPHLPIPIAGASGALFGLIGFGAAYCHFSGGFLRSGYRNFFLTWGLYGFIFGYIIRADNIAHGGGFAAGVLLGWLVERERLHKDQLTRWWGWLAVALALLTFGAYLWMILAKGGQSIGFML